MDNRQGGDHCESDEDASLIAVVAHELAVWEVSDELCQEFAIRLIHLIRGLQQSEGKYVLDLAMTQSDAGPQQGGEDANAPLQIEVTREMVRAGVMALEDARGAYSDAMTVEAVYNAMRVAAMISTHRPSGLPT